MDPSEDIPDPSSPSSSAHLREIATLFLKLGFTAFGGPAAHIAMMEDEVVHRRHWITREHFLHLLAAVNFIPGPNSTELAILLGRQRGGLRGLVVAGVCFIVPAMLIILPLAWLYVHYGLMPQKNSPLGSILSAISASIVAIIAAALFRFARTALKDHSSIILCIFSTAAYALALRYPKSLGGFPPEILLLALAGFIAALRHRRVLPMLLPLPILAAATSLSPFAQMTLIFLRIGATLFGSGYVLVSYLQSAFIDQRPWLTPQELIVAVAIGQFTPGPLLTTATFIGYLLGDAKFHAGLSGGISGALLATLAIFLPAFLFTAAFGPLLDRLRHSHLAQDALTGMNAAVVAMILVTAVRLAYAALQTPETIVIAFVSLIMLLRWNLNATWLIVASALAGLLLR